MEGKSSLGLNENVAGLLCYIAGWVTGLIFYLLEKDSKFVKFHAMQSMITFLSISIIQIVLKIPEGVLGLIGLGFIFSIIGGLLWIIGVIAWIVGMVGAYQGKMVKFPVIGDISEILVSKNNP
jgi:uncharacterized membrane protein